MQTVELLPYSSEYLSHFKKWLLDDELMERMDLEPFLEANIEPWVTNPEQTTLVIKNEKDEVIGFSNFHHFSADEKSAKHGTLIDPIFQGQGYGKLSLLKSIDYGFEKLGLDEIKATAKEDNPTSIRNIESCGFAFDHHDKIKRKRYYYIKK